MINEIISAISMAINAEFGDEYEIYTESVEQGLNEPCFFILCLNPKTEQFLGDKYYRRHKFCIHYFPKSNEENREIHDVCERLFNCLELIQFKDRLIRGTDVTSEKTDGVLHFFVNYNFFTTIERKEENTMDSATYSVNVKGQKNNGD